MIDDEDCELEEQQFVQQIFTHGHLSASHNIADLAYSSPTHIAKQEKHSTAFRAERNKFEKIPVFLEDAMHLRNYTNSIQQGQKARFRK